MGAAKYMGTYGHSLSVTKHAFFVLCMYRGHPNIIHTYRGCPNIWGVQTYRGHPNTGHPNIQGVFKHTGVSKHMGTSKHAGGIQTYGRCPNIQGQPLM